MPDDQIDKLVRDAKVLGQSRLLRDEDQVTPEIAAQIIHRMRAHQKVLKVSQGKLARSIGISKATLSLVLDGRYRSDPSPHLRAIDKWLESELVRASGPKPGAFVMTSVAEAIYAAAHYAIKMNAMVLVHGPSGVGKSLTLSAIRAETPGSVLVPIRTGGESPRSIMEALGNACQISERSASMSHRWFLQLEKLLAGTNRLIMIDEAHKLIGRQRDKGLHILRDFYDATNCPMLICGTSDVMYYIQQGTAQHNEALDQLRGRIQCWVDLTERAGSGGDRGPRLATEQDVRMVLARFKMRLTPDAITYLKWLANEPGMGAMRSCVALVALAIELFGSDAEAITGDHLRRAQCVRMGSRAAQSIEDRREATPARAVKVG